MAKGREGVPLLIALRLPHQSLLVIHQDLPENVQQLLIRSPLNLQHVSLFPQRTNLNVLGYHSTQVNQQE